MKPRYVLGALVLLSCVVVIGVLQAGAMAAPKTAERGRYLVQVCGCNDCHTPGYMMSEGKIPEELWLTGDTFGWRGPWGTTYAANLRLLMQDYTEDAWVTFAKGLKARPPMPWFSVNVMEEQDLRDIYRYIRLKGPSGKPAPAYLTPDQEPPPPFALFPSPPPAK